MRCSERPTRFAFHGNGHPHLHRVTRDEYFGAEKIDLSDVHFSAALLSYIPAHIARYYRVLPVFDDPPSLGVALADPSDLDVVDGVYAALQRDLVLRVADARQLDAFVERFYGGSHS